MLCQQLKEEALLVAGSRQPEEAERDSNNHIMARSPSHSGGRIGEFLYVGLCLLLLGFSIHFWQDNIYGDEGKDFASDLIPSHHHEGSGRKEG